MTASLDAHQTMCNDLLTVNRGCGMAGFFTKLDAGITDSTIWHQPDHTRLTWITMLAMADQHGYVGASIPGLASRARVPLDACVAALECFKSPDEYSRTKDHDGRRIADADGGWVLLNHAKYRAAQNADDRRERSRIAMADLRARRKATSATIVNGEQSLTQLPQAEADNRSRTEAIQTPSPRKRGSAGGDGFDLFWKAYPRKISKVTAEKAFSKLAPSVDLLDEIVAAIERQKACPQWTKDGGQFIPHPASWLNSARWQDEADTVASAFGGAV